MAPRVAGVQKILIVLLGAIGDVTRALPILPRLRALYPNARIGWAVEPASLALVERHPHIDEVFLFERPKGLRAFVSFLRAVRCFAPDLTLDLQRHAKSGVITLASGAKTRLGFHRKNSREGNFLCLSHTIEPQPHLSSKLGQFQRFADWLGAPVLPVSFGIVPTAAEELRVEELLRNVPRPFVAAFVGSSAPSRLWFPARTARVIDALHAQGVATVLVGGQREREFAASVREQTAAPVLDLTGATNLRELYAVFQQSSAAFGPDSGPMHIAAAAGIPVVSLWGATSPQRSAPWGSESLVIEGAAPCSPCYRKECPIGRACMAAISAKQVLERLQVALGRDSVQS
ncbi:MAG: glycosyltransferase family 9 protein [Candidatus Binatia bacterium]|nr:glycosyltransferase family 9 protein [Candidatus Binatia bacterium]